MKHQRFELSEINPRGAWFFLGCRYFFLRPQSISHAFDYIYGRRDVTKWQSSVGSVLPARVVLKLFLVDCYE